MKRPDVKGILRNSLAADLKRLKPRAFHRAEWAGDVLRRYHLVVRKLTAAAVQQIQPLYLWLFVPPTLWPFNVEDALGDCLTILERGKCLSARQRLLIDLVSEPPDETVCEAVAQHEHLVHKGAYENAVKTQAKYEQTELALCAAPEFHRQWRRIKKAFKVAAYRDHKGVIRRTMTAERNLRSAFSANLRDRDELFRVTFDAFCLRWNLYGMQRDKPLLLKLSVNLTPYGTLIHIPAYWSFDPKRDIRWGEIAKLHRIRVPHRQGAALAEGLAQRMQDAKRLRRLDKEAVRRGLKGDAKHEFLCAALGWHLGTSPKRLARLRSEFP